ncbi:sulfurtransferase complex subunit TusD [Psychrobacter sp. K31L]|uniref:sulfurtransferase complex subunit TusD n=1 Tax=Psychrobacter sp. K31L TaxID=2820758 RepID=UPI001B33C273|nr:sulfurtransferase complex subunit TusD [Psychrobacter sp. K31L]MBP3945790.1 sulfurtransferase complex subunit TusD [Psychrobacter sp. K31L]
MTTTTPLLLITADPSHPLAHLALRYARAYLKSAANSHDIEDNDTNSTGSSDNATTEQPLLNVFFYGDSAHIANRLRWQSAEQINLTQEWKNLAKQYQLPLPVCVSTALSRGISDSENGTRHRLDGDNLAKGFTLVGLSELAMMMQSNCRLIQF